MESQDIPIHRGYYVEDLRTAEVGHWKARGYNAAFIQLEGMPAMCEGRITEIPPGGELPAMKLGFDELVYVLQGEGASLRLVYRLIHAEELRVASAQFVLPPEASQTPDLQRSR